MLVPATNESARTVWAAWGTSWCPSATISVVDPFERLRAEQGEVVANSPPVERSSSSQSPIPMICRKA